MGTETTAITIDLGEGKTAPMTPPPVLGAAFAAVVSEALSWDGARTANVDAAFGAVVNDDDFDNASYLLGEAFEAAALGWSCQFGEPNEPAEAGPYTETLADAGRSGASTVASAVLARDLGILTETNFTILTGWWIGAGLSLPRPSACATFAKDEDEAQTRASELGYARYHVDGWPLAAVTDLRSN